VSRRSSRARAAAHHDPIEPVLADEGERHRFLPAVQQLLLRDRVAGGDVETAGRRVEGRQDELDAIH